MRSVPAGPVAAEPWAQLGLRDIGASSRSRPRRDRLTDRRASRLAGQGAGRFRRWRRAAVAPERGSRATRGCAAQCPGLRSRRRDASWSRSGRSESRRLRRRAGEGAQRIRPARSPHRLRARRRRSANRERMKARSTSLVSFASYARRSPSGYGSVSTHCRSGTAGRTRSTRCAAVSAMRRPPYHGHKPRRLHEKATRRSWTPRHGAADRGLTWAQSGHSRRTQRPIRLRSQRERPEASAPLQPTRPSRIAPRGTTAVPTPPKSLKILRPDAGFRDAAIPLVTD